MTGRLRRKRIRRAWVNYSRVVGASRFFLGLFTVDNCTRVARVCSTDRQVGRQAARGRSAAATGATTVCSGEGCGGADNVFVRGRLWEEEGR